MHLWQQNVVMWLILPAGLRILGAPIGNVTNVQKLFATESRFAALVRLQVNGVAKDIAFSA